MAESQTHTLTFYLLRNGFNPNDALDMDKGLEPIEGYAAIKGARLYILKTEREEPWWKKFLGLNTQTNINQEYPGGILFLPIKYKNSKNKYWVAVVFGYARHCLKAIACETGFGLRVALNAVDENTLRGVDILDPGTARRARIQSPRNSKLDFFSDRWDRSLLKRISGHVQGTYKKELSCVTGSNSIRVTTKKSAKELMRFCTLLLNLYLENTYTERFPEISSIQTETDSNILDTLNSKLLAAVKDRKNNQIFLAYPDMLDFQEFCKVKFGKLAPCASFELNTFRDIMKAKLDELSLKDLNENFGVTFYDSDEQPLNKTSVPLYRCLIWDYDGHHFCEGVWYKVDQEYLLRLQNKLDPYFKPMESPLDDYHDKDEGVYNDRIGRADVKTILMDRKLVYIENRSGIELCDLCVLQNDGVDLIHVKFGTASSQLSHLFSQGYVGTRLLRNAETDEHIHSKLKAWINKLAITDTQKKKLKDRILNKKTKTGTLNRKMKIRFGIICNHGPKAKSDVLPIFSRINLSRTIDDLKAMNVDVQIEFIKGQKSSNGISPRSSKGKKRSSPKTSPKGKKTVRKKDKAQLHEAT